MKKYKLLYITNIPTPYRNKRFNLMQEILTRKSIDFEVLYMAENEPNRKWEVDYSEIKYKYRIFKGLHPTIGNMFAHFNPGLFKVLRKETYDLVVVGGMGCPSHWIAPFFVNRNAKKILSVESNLNSVKVVKGLGAWLKKTLIRQYDAYQVTGDKSIDYLRYFFSDIQGPFIELPNIIDEQKYKYDVASLHKDRAFLRSELGIDEETQLWVCPARLEEIKGLHLLLPLLENVPSIRLMVVGDGSQKEVFQKMINEKNLPVTLLGFKQQEDMLKLYAASDLFVLPSLSDPSPLSPIEAIAGILPVLVSDKIGNYDHIYNGKNGWGINMDNDIEANKRLIHDIASMTNEQLKKKGKFSSELYDSNFNSRLLIESYSDSLLELIGEKSTVANKEYI